MTRGRNTVVEQGARVYPTLDNTAAASATPFHLCGTVAVTVHSSCLYSIFISCVAGAVNIGQDEVENEQGPGGRSVGRACVTFAGVRHREGAQAQLCS